MAGHPFKTRFEGKKGLAFPNVKMGMFPNYICEACQVRAVLDREIQARAEDLWLLQFERMRQIDTVNEWSTNTLSKYGGRLNNFAEFDRLFGVRTLFPTALRKPPTTPAIPIIWAQLRYSLRPGQKKDSTVTFGTTRAMRTAAGFYYSWDMQQAFPGQVYKLQKRHMYSPYVPPTEEMVATLQHGGMARRMGNFSRPSWSLQFTHIRFVEDQLERAYLSAPNDRVRKEIANAGTAHLMLWLGMLRGGENFNLKREDIAVVQPEDSALHGLALGLGFVEARLSAETKTSRNKVADIVIAFQCVSGLSLGKWMNRLLAFPDESEKGLLFSSENRAKWSSGYFRHTYLWPLLELQKLQGEPTLKAFSDAEGHRIRDKVYSCHSYRRGLTSFVARKRIQNIRRALEGELNEHARWRERMKAKGVASPTMGWHYASDMDLEARLDFTLQCC